MDGYPWAHGWNPLEAADKKEGIVSISSEETKGVGLVVLGSRFVKISLNCAPALQESP
jgi:hypothetical protein